MRYGFYLPTRGQTATSEALEALVQRGEALGFSSVMIADHIVFPVTINSKYPYTVSGAFPGQGDALEQLALMAFIAGKTRTLRLVTSVMIVPHRIVFDFRSKRLDESLERMERFAPVLRTTARD